MFRLGQVLPAVGCRAQANASAISCSPKSSSASLARTASATVAVMLFGMDAARQSTINHTHYSLFRVKLGYNDLFDFVRGNHANHQHVLRYSCIHVCFRFG